MKFFLFPPAYGGGGRYYQLIWTTTKSTTAYEDTSREILMQSHFLSDAFFDSLRSVRFTDRSIIN
ncbi:MAG: hypothetical protein LBR79_06885 [Oscillospiraceae bacterium]|nr:hypothetical protein [Oscillospiraceae bacterium]